MPYKDRERKLEALARWRQRSTPGYHAWLYRRRKLRLDDAERFRRAIEAALAAPDWAAADGHLLAALAEADAEAEAVGDRYDHEKDEPYFEEER